MTQWKQNFMFQMPSKIRKITSSTFWSGEEREVEAIIQLLSAEFVSW